MKRSVAAIGALGALALAFAAGPSIAAGTAGYHVTSTYQVGGDGGWDYLTYDTAGKRLFVTRGTHVMVVDAASGNVTGDIPNTPGVHGVALAPDLGKGFTSNGRDNSVTVFDLRTLAVITTIPIDGKNPDAILYEPVSKRVFTFNGGSNNASVIDANANSAIGTIALGGRPEFAAAGSDGTVFVNIEDKSTLAAIDAKTSAVLRTTPLAP